MIHNYGNTKILLLFYMSECLIDATTQDIKQRIYTLRNYHKNDENLKRFFNNCEIKILEFFPCKNRHELRQRIQFYEQIFQVKPFGLRFDMERRVKMLEDRRKAKEAKKKEFIMGIPINFVLNWD